MNRSTTTEEIAMTAQSTTPRRSCGDCAGQPADYRSDFGHLAYNPTTGGTELVPHTKTVRLIGAGIAPAVQADELVVGDRILYNYAATGLVVAIAPVGDSFLRFDVEARDGKTYRQQFRRDRLVGIVR